jgi:tRNA (guanine9-N1)-methyltransferase
MKLQANVTFLSENGLIAILSLVTPMDPPTHPPPLSKSAQKKAARAVRYAELKLERRAREKEAKKEKKRILAEKRAAGELDDDDEAEKARKQKKPRIEFGGQVVIDLSFDRFMSEKV